MTDQIEQAATIGTKPIILGEKGKVTVTFVGTKGSRSKGGGSFSKEESNLTIDGADVEATAVAYAGFIADMASQDNDVAFVRADMEFVPGPAFNAATEMCIATVRQASVTRVGARVVGEGISSVDADASATATVGFLTKNPLTVTATAGVKPDPTGPTSSIEVSGGLELQQQIPDGQVTANGQFKYQRQSTSTVAGAPAGSAIRVTDSKLYALVPNRKVMSDEARSTVNVAASSRTFYDVGVAEVTVDNKLDVDAEIVARTPANVGDGTLAPGVPAPPPGSPTPPFVFPLPPAVPPTPPSGIVVPPPTTEPPGSGGGAGPGTPATPGAPPVPPGAVPVPPDAIPLPPGAIPLPPGAIFLPPRLVGEPPVVEPLVGEREGDAADDDDESN
jgi:hypothetical protein